MHALHDCWPIALVTVKLIFRSESLYSLFNETQHVNSNYYPMLCACMLELHSC